MTRGAARSLQARAAEEYANRGWLVVPQARTSTSDDGSNASDQRVHTQIPRRVADSCDAGGGRTGGRR